MNGFAFQTGLNFEWDGVLHRIERLMPNDQILLERLSDGQAVISTRGDLMSDYLKGRVSASKAAYPARLLEKQYGRSISELPKYVQDEVRRRMAYIAALEENGSFVFMDHSLKPLIDEVAGNIGDTKPPSITTLFRWNSCYRHSKEIRTLIPRYDRRGCRDLKQQGRCLELLEDAAREAFAASPRASVRDVHDLLVGKINAENHKRLPQGQIRTPALRTAYNLMDRMEVYDAIVLKDGKAAADRRIRVTGKGPKVSRILERVEADHTPLDLFLIDHVTGLPLGRPTLTIFIDVYSRFPVGYYLSYGGTSASAVLGGLRHAILPKKTGKEEIPNLSVNHPWPCFGLIESLVLDNGLEFHGTDLESIAFDLGIRLQYCPKRQPRFKGVVERYLKTVNYYFAHKLPGTSFARLVDRGDYDPMKHALLTLAEFNHLFEKWLLDVYAQTIHRGIKTTPWAKWHEGLAKTTPKLPGSVDDLQRRIGLVEERTLGHQGILLNNLYYAGQELLPVVRTWGLGIKVRVVFDPEDLGRIHVWPPQQQEPITVRAVNFAYADGLTLFQHELIQKKVREEGKDASDADALAQAKYDIAQAIGELMTSRKLKQRRHSAKVCGVNSRNPSATFDAAKPPPPSPIPPQPFSFDDDQDDPPETLPPFHLLPIIKGNEQ